MEKIMIKIMLLGAKGQLGYELIRSLQGLGELVSLSRPDIDFAHLDQLEIALSKFKPDIIVNAAAYTAVDKAEEERARAELINTAMPIYLAEYCNRTKSMLLHYSSDYVFSGQTIKPYLESDPMEPLNHYGWTKAKAEQGIMASGAAHLILRTSWVYALRGHNFIKTMIHLAQQRAQLRVIGDQISAPTWAGSLAVISAHLISKALERKSRTGAWPSGLYHACASDYTSWHGLAVHALATLRPFIGEHWALQSESEIIAIKTEEYPLPATRPLQSSMNPNALQEDWQLAFPSWQTQFHLCFEPWLTREK